jgi:glycosyltransferase involved in cell wall biosynthesis
MSDATPLVSIGLPVYNGEPLLRAALESLRAQTYPHFELIISDNASTDATPSICREFAAADPRIHYHRSDANRGAALNFQRVLQLALGEFFMWAAHDDLWAPEFIAANLRPLRRRPDAIASMSRVAFVDDSSVIWHTLWGRYGTSPLMGSVRSNLLTYLCYPGTNSRVYALYRTAVLRRCGNVTPCWGADTTFVVKTLRYGKYYEVKRPLLFRRRGVSRDMRKYVRENNRTRLGQLFPFWEATRDILQFEHVPKDLLTGLCLLNLNALHTLWYWKECIFAWWRHDWRK